MTKELIKVNKDCHYTETIYKVYKTLVNNAQSCCGFILWTV